jgi:hypothetical protein
MVIITRRAAANRCQTGIAGQRSSRSHSRNRTYTRNKLGSM